MTAKIARNAVQAIDGHGTNGVRNGEDRVESLVNGQAETNGRIGRVRTIEGLRAIEIVPVGRPVPTCAAASTGKIDTTSTGRLSARCPRLP